ncbi:MAG: LytTR family DNA-binding domain-containing protein [Bacteroidetes bacterium]|nr:LytTR family DNA-binding domain-containing protein [Bacteroidota bacterium]
MKVLIIEDELPAAKRMAKLLLEIDNNIEILDIKDGITSSVDWFKNNPPPDLVFMDIQLSDGLSFEIFEHVQLTSPIVFTTAFDQYAIRAFKVNSIDYILKPIDKNDVRKSLEKFKTLTTPNNHEQNNSELISLIKNLKENKPVFKSRFLVKTGNSYIKVSIDQCAYFTVENKLTYLITFTGKKHLIDPTLEDLGNQLDPQKFFRANRQFIISIDAIKDVHTYFSGKLKIHLKVETKEDVIISRAKATMFKEWIDV